MNHKVKKKAINKKISLEYKEIEVKSEKRPVAKLEVVVKTWRIGKKTEIMKSKKKNLAIRPASNFDDESIFVNGVKLCYNLFCSSITILILTR